MKSVATFPLVLTVFVSSVAFAQADPMPGMGANGMKMAHPGSSACAGMEHMKAMPMHKCNDGDAKNPKEMTYQASAMVKGIDSPTGKVMLAHEAVKSLNWPAMTMGFKVKDKTLFDKLAIGKQVDVEFRKDGMDYVIVSVK